MAELKLQLKERSTQIKVAPPPRPPPPPPPVPPADPSSMKTDLSQGGPGGGQRVGGRQRDNSQVYAAESEVLDQIAKEVRMQL